MERVLSSDSEDELNEQSSHRELYKYTNRTISFTVEKKRQLFLQEQKDKRDTAFDEKRDLSQLFGDGASPELMECEQCPRKKTHVKKFPFGYKLMGSEWFTEVPEDLTENWLMKLCPEGVRQLVVANNAVTTCYYRNGRRSCKFKSKLPGGSAESAHKFTLLDCVYNKTVNTLFVYDVLAWNSLSLLNAEAHMRFCWLKSKFEENPDILEINSSKKFNFMLINALPAEKALLQDQLFTPFVVKDCEVPWDGLLFYHREGHYTFNCSPLVGWLRTFMVPEVFNIDVHPSHLSNKPSDYDSLQQYMSSKKKKKDKEKIQSERSEEMENENMEYDNS